MSLEKDADFHARGIDKLFELSKIGANDDKALIMHMKDVFLLVVECDGQQSSAYWRWIGRFCLTIGGKRGLSCPLKGLPPDPPNRKKGDRELAEWLFKRTTNLYQQIEQGSRLKGDQQIECDNQFVRDCGKLAELAKCYLGET